jgi:hypothetical protein
MVPDCGRARGTEACAAGLAEIGREPVSASSGVVIVSGMLYVTSGYIGLLSGQPGNPLLAFGPPAQ